MAARRLVVFAVVWLATVAGASALTWSVISATGARVGDTITIAVTESGAPAPASGTQAWSGRGGRLSATCAGDAISLVAAVPDVGYWVKVYDRGPEELKVDFESTDPDDSREVRLSATCADGVPVFRRR